MGSIKARRSLGGQAEKKKGGEKEIIILRVIRNIELAAACYSRELLNIKGLLCYGIWMI